MMQQTSMEAFESIRHDLGAMQQRVYDTIQEHPGMSNHDISRYLHIEINKITPRTKELRDYGLVFFSHYKQDTLTKKRVMCWK